MRATTVASAAATFAAALAQTPDGFFKFQVSTDVGLGVKYGSTTVVPNDLLAQSLVSTQPTVFSNTTYPDTYILLLVDESIPKSRYPANESSSLAIGLGANFTTRLHWWATDITQSPDKTFTNSSPALAEYGGPMPPAGDAAHTYVFYLFPQPEGYTPPAEALAGDYTAKSASARLNFSVEAVGSSVSSSLLAANYFRTQNSTTTANGTATSGSGSGSGSNASTSATPTPSVYEGAAQKVSMGASVVLAGVGMIAFALF